MLRGQFHRVCYVMTYVSIKVALIDRLFELLDWNLSQSHLTMSISWWFYFFFFLERNGWGKKIWFWWEGRGDGKYVIESSHKHGFCYIGSSQIFSRFHLELWRHSLLFCWICRSETFRFSFLTVAFSLWPPLWRKNLDPDYWLSALWVKLKAEFRTPFRGVLETRASGLKDILRTDSRCGLVDLHRSSKIMRTKHGPKKFLRIEPRFVLQTHRLIAVRNMNLDLVRRNSLNPQSVCESVTRIWTQSAEIRSVLSQSVNG